MMSGGVDLGATAWTNGIGSSTELLAVWRKTTTFLPKRYAGPVQAGPCGLGCDGPVRPGAPSLIFFAMFLFYFLFLFSFLT
jgi:hypothetical protein